ncbi:MAG: response regulator [Deltaproteobacteria bacterium]|nr:response regulator [Deltaproteobacteria bacterium]MBN2671294.1 response regulator [Deltaproteobacteria bacterium]
MQKESNVLFVDDDTDVLEGFNRSMRRSRFHVLTATSGEQALQILRQSSIDVIVADYHMPGMSGTELLARAREQWPDTIRIMLTGGASLDAALSATFGGWVYQYLEKPVPTEELSVIIEEALFSKNRQAIIPASRFVLSSEAHRAILSQIRITASPERPTFIADTSMLDWARQLCDEDLLPPELDRIRPLIHALSEIEQIAMSMEDSGKAEERLERIRSALSEIT